MAHRADSSGRESTGGRIPATPSTTLISPSENRPLQTAGLLRATSSSPLGSHSNSGLLRAPTMHPNQLPSSWAEYQQRSVPDAATNWRHFRSLRFSLSGLPRDTTTSDIWNSMSGLVDVVYIMLDEDRQGKRSGRAVVIVEPPPQRNPWPRWRCSIIRNNQSSVTVPIRLEKGTEADGVIQSPLRNSIPARALLNGSALRFGSMVEESTMMSMQVVDGGWNDKIQLKIEFGKRKFFIRFRTNLQHDDTSHTQKVSGPIFEYEISVKFSHIKRLYCVQKQSGDWALIIPLASPPVITRRTDDLSATHSDDKPVWAESELWLRQTDIMREPWLMKEASTQLNKQDQFIDIGRWTTYCVEMPQSDQDAWPSIASALRDYNIRTDLVSDFKFIPQGESNFWTLSKTLTAASTSADALALLDKVHLPFDVRYQLEVCLSHGIFNEHNINLPFLERLYEHSKGESDRARLMLECVAEDSKHMTDPMSMFENSRALMYYPTTWKIPSYCALVRKAVVTPTTIYFNTPTVETTNRVLRNYNDLNDRFLRVQFTDEKTEGRIFASANSKRDDEVYTRVYRTLKNGIVIGDRHYHFLAFGNSQIRENGAYFFCETDFVTCDKIREWMGHLKDIRCVAKFAARMGQCFSTTRQIRGIHVPQIQAIPDIERNGFCFTDGVGKISSFLADLIANDLKLDETPSAFQFRMGGCKGVLVVWPDVKAKEVHIRESQAKFNAAYNGLEIIRCSTFSVGTLNRQTITVLSALGVDDPVFEEFLSTQLANYDEAMKNRNTAKELLTHFVDENEMTTTIAKMLEHDFMETHEPFVWTLLRLWRSWSIKALKEKARVIIEKSAFVLGCVDETGTLRGYSKATALSTRPDRSKIPQIFLQIHDRETGKYKPVMGLCLVGRNPSLHPGDLRIVEAVDCATLRHLKNVVVFPQTGDRDIPSMCSGGDLDGDDYFVFWDQKLLPPIWNYPPMNYAAEQPMVLNREVSIGDVIQFFVLYMKNDSLPKIAHAHLAQADWLDEHALSDKCKELAALHSKAVDYVKSGNPAQMPKRLQPRQWPHFMEKRQDKTYHSRQALGKLYDQVQKIEFQPAYEMPFDKRILNRYKLDSETLKKARKTKSKYDTAMRRLMAQNEINTEFELFSTFVLSNPRVGTGYKLQETIGREAAALKDRFKSECLRYSGADGRWDIDKLYPFVAAMYQVTNEEVKIALHESRTPHISTTGQQFVRKITSESMPLISFPWIFHLELGRIASGEARPTSPEAVTDMKEPAVEVKSEGAPKRESLKLDDFVEMDYVRTSDGKVIHRGEILNLFGGSDDEEDAYYTTAQGGTDVTQNETVAESDIGNVDGSSKVLDAEPLSNFAAIKETLSEVEKPQRSAFELNEVVMRPDLPKVTVSTKPATSLKEPDGLDADLSDIPPLQLPSPVGPVAGESSDELLGEDEVEFVEEELEIEEETALEKASKLGLF